MATNFLNLATGVLIPSGYKAETLYGIVPINDNTTGIDADAFDFITDRTDVATRVNSDLLLEQMAIDVPRLQYSGTSCPYLLMEKESTNILTYPVSFDNVNYWTPTNCTVDKWDPINTLSMGTDVLDGWDFTSDWVTIFATVDDSNSFTNTSAIGGVRRNTILTVGTYYMMRISGTTAASNVSLLDGANNVLLTNLNGTFDETFYFQAQDTDILIMNSSLGTTDINTMYIYDAYGFTSPHSDYPTDAVKLTANSEDVSIDLDRPLRVTGETVYTNSIYVKRATGTGNIYLKDITDGDTTLINVTDEWQRFAVTESSPNKNGYFGVRIFDDDDAVYIYGAQVEESEIETSFIYDGTEGTEKTRVRDYNQVIDLQSNNLITENEYTIYLHILDITEPDNQSYVWRFGNNVGSTRYSLQRRNTDPTNLWRIYDNVSAAWYSPFENSDVPAKVAIRVTGGTTLTMFLNGVKASADYTIPTPFEFDRLRNDFNVCQHLQKLMTFNTALTDAQCIELTTL